MIRFPQVVSISGLYGFIGSVLQTPSLSQSASSMWDSVSQWPSEQSVAQNETQNSNLKHRLTYGAEPQLKLQKLPPDDTDTQLISDQ